MPSTANSTVVDPFIRAKLSHPVYITIQSLDSTMQVYMYDNIYLRAVPEICFPPPTLEKETPIIS
jgi:hypothetical protein